MTLPTSGPISMGDINVELGRSRTTSISLNSAQNGLLVTIRPSASPKPTPNDQASISEWRGYQHVSVVSYAHSFNNVLLSTYNVFVM